MGKRQKLSNLERIMVYEKTDGHCAYCGTPLKFKEMQVDHVKPFSMGGANTLDNLLPACRYCNHYKSSRTLESFRSALTKIVSVLTRDSATYAIAARFGRVLDCNTPVKFYFENKTDFNIRQCVKTALGNAKNIVWIRNEYDAFGNLSETHIVYDAKRSGGL